MRTIIVLTPEELSRLASLELQARAIVEGILSGHHHSPARGVSIEFAEHRQYAPGDDLRHIDWKVFGRRDRYYVRQYEMESDLTCHLLLDVTESMTYQSVGTPVSKLAYAKWLLAAIGFVVIQQQDLVSLSTIDRSTARQLPAGGRLGHWQAVVDRLKGITPTATPARSERPFATALEQFTEQTPRRSVVVIASDCLRPLDEIRAGLQAARSRRHDVLLWHVLDPAEWEFAFEGPVLFQGMELLGEQLVETRSLKQAYQAEVRKFCDGLELACRDLRVDYHRVLTREPVDLVLRQALVERGGARSAGS
ncbi:MAG: DUF58 domain-containing protein [Planctomycetota bacterium]|nr:MAG: DUF58 domain-containing protein [Planctomycetota bacterium]